MKTEKFAYEEVDTTPVKSFFVEMLTRDIALEDAILDLLDNCVDGVLRTREGHKAHSKPYDGFCAEISFDHDGFTISDNCGGIPWDLHSYAFHMGRPAQRTDAVPGSVGVYGIGMKRAIFKMGQHCLISTKNKKHSYDIEITPQWLKSEEWKIMPVPSKHPLKTDGTTIIVGDLHEGIAHKYSKDAAFESGLMSKIGTHYAFIIEKGFKVTVNGREIPASPTKLLFAETLKDGRSLKAIRPYIFKGKIEGVDVFLAVGLTRALPSQSEVDKGLDEGRYSSIGAGWTVLCNDRAVLYCDKTEVTGWGDGVPRYHTQFIAISGVVEFKCADAKKLPTTTTKRGIDASSRLYLQVRIKMREGLKIFTDYTYKWKGKEEESKKQLDAAGAPISIDTLRAKVDSGKIPMNTTRGTAAVGEQYKPSLPLPGGVDDRKRISFQVPNDDFAEVSEYLFKKPDANPAELGEKCFNLVLREAGK